MKMMIENSAGRVHVPGPVTGLLGIIFVALVLSGCSPMSRAGNAVADSARSVVSAVKRGTKKTVSKISSDGSTHPTPRSDGGFDLTGVLMVVDPSTCPATRDCGPRYQLFNEDFSVRTALSGELHDVHDGLIVTVTGQWQAVDDGPLAGPGWRRTDQTVRVDEYSIHTGVRYRSFLSRKVSEYGRRVYDCVIRWPESYAWRIVNQAPFLIVRLTGPHSDTGASPFLELWYHGDSGTFLREAKSHTNLDPCVW